MGCLHDPANV